MNELFIYPVEEWYEYFLLCELNLEVDRAVALNLALDGQ